MYSQVAAADAGGRRAASGDVFWDSRALLLRIFEAGVVVCTGQRRMVLRLCPDW